MAKRTESIIQSEKQCYVCHTTVGLHCHHVFYGNGNRAVSERNGFKVWLCYRHHNMSDEGVHFNKELDMALKKEVQRKYEETHTRKEFMELVGKNFL